ncbi:Aminoacyl tRNA synthase complex-interacting multifunctional protein 1-like [Homarus americanus]|uniref:Aminoacyl tRNA synthase complex-interacting multifunctional protein 1-like n=1 Tax=Homarus americanus TaxID=6706 RepID=A0A8J5K1N7_HOMAM|nr:Aminoacyl tRNA synthase complex-interacting multifunctional protein 1-like [Homarus americanus]
MASPEVLSRLEQRAVQAEQMIQVLTKQVGQLQKVAVSALKDELRRENLELLQEVDKLKTCLLSHEKTQGITQYYDFTSQMTPSSSACDPQIQADVISPPVQASPAPQTNKQNKEKGDKKSEKKEKKAGGGGGKKQEEGPVDVSRLDFRVGRIVDVGEEKIRTVISGLVRHIPLEEMQNRVVVLLCNLKPANMRGIASEAMIMCASTPDKVEILAPPAGSQPGDLIEFEGYTRNPDAVLNPKKKIFETCAPDLKTDANKVAMYKGIPFTVPGKGIVLSQTMSNVQIK